jgi:hypothetical protein
MMIVAGVVLMALAVALVLTTARREVLVDSDRLTPGTVATTMLIVAAGIVLFLTGAAIVGMSLALMVGALLKD